MKPVVLRQAPLESGPRELRPTLAPNSAVVTRFPLDPVDPAVERMRSEAARAGHAEGHARGLEEGRRAGLAEGLEQAKDREAAALQAVQDDAEHRCATDAARLSEAIDRLQAIGEALQRQFDGVRRAAEDDAIAAAWTAVCRLVGDAAADRDRTAALVRSAAAAAADAAPLVIRLHPDDANVVTGKPKQTADAGIEWRPDPSIAPGGCIVSHARGRLDARLDSQLAALREAWLEAAGAAEDRA